MPRLARVFKLGCVFVVLSTLVIFSMQFTNYESTQDSEGLPGKEDLNHVKMKAESHAFEEDSNQNARDVPINEHPDQVEINVVDQISEKDRNINDEDGNSPANQEDDDGPQFYDNQFDVGGKDMNEERVMSHLKQGDRTSSNPNIHAFYYSWYGNPEKDGEYIHWNHQYLPHWNAKISAQYPTGQKHQPPDDIGVLALSWYPPEQADDNGKPVEDYVQVIFDLAEEYNIKVCFHIEPYTDRNPQSVRKDIEYIINTYGDHPAFYRHTSMKTEQQLPLIYLYDTYLIKPTEWKRLFNQNGDISIRDSEYDCFAIGLLVDEKHLYDIKSSGFDGMYTYFAADGFSYGSTRTKWKDIAVFASRNNLLFIPSVGPGYDDTRVRPWNKGNSRDRQDGAYYELGWQTAAACNGVEIISITSFNEWHEGTQIEPASDKPEQGSFPYLTYGSKGSDYYLQLTKKWSDMWMAKMKRNED